MNHANIKLQAFIQQFDEVAQVLELLYVFADVDILPIDDPLGLSPHLLEMYRHVWLDAVTMGIKLQIAQGGFSDADGIQINLEEQYLLDSVIPSGIVPKNQIALASVIDVDAFLAELRAMFVYSKFYCVYRAKSQAKTPVPSSHVKIPGVGISPSSSGGWFAPSLMPSDFNEGGLLLGLETHTPNTSGWSAWYNSGGRMFLLFHPAITNILRSNFPNTGFGSASEEVWTFKLTQVSPPDYPGCIRAYSILSADMNAHFKQYYCSRMRLAADSILPNHERGDWASYDWSASIDPYYWSHPDHNNCPLACDLCWKHVIGYGANSLLILREWVLHSYGRPGTNNRDLYPFISTPPEEFFQSYQGTDLSKYFFINGLTPDIEIPESSVVGEWNSTGAYDGSVALSHYGGVSNYVRYPDMIILDRAVYFLSAAGIAGGAFSASPINYIRNYRHQGDRRDGILYLLGAKIPDDYTVYYRPEPGPILPPPPWAVGPQFKSLLKGELKISQDDMVKYSLMYGGETLEYNGEELIYL